MVCKTKPHFRHYIQVWAFIEDIWIFKSGLLLTTLWYSTLVVDITVLRCGLFLMALADHGSWLLLRTLGYSSLGFY